MRLSRRNARRIRVGIAIGRQWLMRYESKDPARMTGTISTLALPELEFNAASRTIVRGVERRLRGGGDYALRS